MTNFRATLSRFVWATWALILSLPVKADSIEDVLSRHMVAEALLAAHFVAAAEKSGMDRDQINAVLQEVAQASAVDEFWITDSEGHAYLTNTGIDFTFDSDPARQPQASAFWPLVSGDSRIVVQAARKREIDDQVFKYVGVAGIDKPRIVQVGIGSGGIPTCYENPQSPDS